MFDDDDDDEFIVSGADFVTPNRDLRYTLDQADDKAKANPTLFSQLMAGKTVGKRVQLLTRFTDAARPVSNSFVNVLELKGPDLAAMPVQVTLGNPKVIPLSPSFTLTQAQDAVERQNASGSLDNFDVENATPAVAYTPMIAVIDWGVGGVSVDSVEVDFLNGLCLNLTCSFLRIRCLIDPFISLLTNTTEAGSNAIYELAAFVGPGKAKRNNAQRTIPLGNFINVAGVGTNGFSPVVPVPKYANRASVTFGPGLGFDPSTITGWRAQIVFMTGAPNAGFITDPSPAQLKLVIGTFTVNDGFPLQVPVPNGAMFAAVRNLSAFQLNNPQIIFDLGI